MVDGEAVKNPPKHIHQAVEYIGLNEYQHRTALKRYVGVDPRYTESVSYTHLTLPTICSV